MRLVLRLSAAFALLTSMSTAGLGFEMRQQLHKDESDRFDHDVKAAYEAVSQEVRRQGESDRKLILSACQSGELVDRALTWMQRGEIDQERTSMVTALVPNTRVAVDVNELLLVTGDGEVLAADPRELMGTPPLQVAADLRPNQSHFALRLSPKLGLVSRCRSDSGGRTAGLIGVRHLVPLLARIGGTLKVDVRV